MKSKNIISAVILLAFLMLAFTVFAIYSRKSTKQLMVQNYGYNIDASFVEDVRDQILTLENNLRGLALIGALYYKTDRSDELTNKVIKKIFMNYPNTLGGGIWYKTYSIDNSKYKCFYAFRNKDNNVVVDKNFSSKEYDYPNQSWYKEIMSKITSYDIVWTRPYYENLGSYTKMVTAGTGIYVDGELVGIATVDWEVNTVIEDISKMKPVEKAFSMYYKKGKKIKNSFALFGNADEDYIIATNDPYLDGKALVGHSLKEIPWYSDNLFGITYIEYHGKKYVPFYRKLPNGMVLVLCIPKLEIFRYVDSFYFPWVFGILLFIFAILALTYYGMNRYLVNPIDKLINIAHKISKGEDIEIKIEKPAEFAQLASTFDKMTKDIKTITKERAKIIADLSVAKQIQESSLPDISTFSARKEFDIYASMEAAKEVGGDFYDIFFIDESKLMFLIADVSGKGVPAALFMMTVKTLINNISQVGYTPKQLIKTINQKICEINKQGFFITLLSCIVDINTGETNIINCGHNLPLIKRNNGKYEYLQLNSNIVLGVFDDADFEIYKTVINPGDIIYTYTDGVTESINEKDEIYGEERLINCLNEGNETETTSIAQKIKTSLTEYTDSTPQSDDITMLVFKYNGKSNYNMKTFKQTADKENYNSFYNWLHEICNEWNITPDTTNKLDMCAEEIFANIVFYAYPETTGDIEVEFKKSDSDIIMEFRDEGTEYNPLEKPDPDINLPPEERPLGGLGIFMVKNMVDNIFYKRENNKNILTLIFKI